MYAAVLAATCLFAAGDAAEERRFWERSASSGGVQITLRILNERVEAERGYPHFHIELRNVGRELIYIYGVATLPEKIIENSLGKFGTRLEMRTPGGGAPMHFPGDHGSDSTSPSPRKHSPPPPTTIRLAPGEGTPIECGGDKPHVSGRDWCPMGFWFFYKPGNYRIRAVYDEGRVIVRTPWIDLPVMPAKGR